MFIKVLIGYVAVFELTVRHSGVTNLDILTINVGSSFSNPTICTTHIGRGKAFGNTGKTEKNAVPHKAVLLAQHSRLMTMKRGENKDARQYYLAL